MKKKILIISFLVIVGIILASLIAWRTQENKKKYNTIVEECKQEFLFVAPDEGIVAIRTERFNDDYIVEIFGEEHYGIYMYTNERVIDYGTYRFK